MKIRKIPIIIKINFEFFFIDDEPFKGLVVLFRDFEDGLLIFLVDLETVFNLFE